MFLHFVAWLGGVIGCLLTSPNNNQSASTSRLRKLVKGLLSPGRAIRRHICGRWVAYTVKALKYNLKASVPEPEVIMTTAQRLRLSYHRSDVGKKQRKYPLTNSALPLTFTDRRL